MVGVGLPLPRQTKSFVPLLYIKIMRMRNRISGYETGSHYSHSLYPLSSNPLAKSISPIQNYSLFLSSIFLQVSMDIELDNIWAQSLERMSLQPTPSTPVVQTQ